MNATRLILSVLCLVAASTASLAQTTILLADDSKTPSVRVSWPTRDGKVTELKGDRRFQSAAQKAPLGPNLDCYVALGGTRLGKGLADPSGAVVLLGLYKKDPAKPLFENIADNAAVAISLRGVFMNRPAVPRPKTAMMHLKYMLEDLKACGLSGNARNLFNTADPEDPVIARAAGGSVRPGCLDGKGPEHGSVEATTEADGSVSITFIVPYALLRHTQDPYQRTNPGGFFEPNHFHVEIELVPKPAKEESPPAVDSKPAPDSPKAEAPK
jgi:hypothetical protein